MYPLHRNRQTDMTRPVLSTAQDLFNVAQAMYVLACSPCCIRPQVWRLRGRMRGPGARRMAM
eukprot:11674-Eustigmatos_ZCMA.PRE.1